MKQLLVLFLGGLLTSNQVGAAPIVYEAALSGAAENPSNASPGSGFARVTFDDSAHTLLVDITFSGLSAPNTAAHIHCCTLPSSNIGVATSTPTFTGFPTGSTSGSYLHLFDLTLASSFNAPFLTNNGGTPAGAEAALGAGLANGLAYVNIHSMTFAGGEIRGQLAAVVPLPAAGVLLPFGLAFIGWAGRKRTA